MNAKSIPPAVADEIIALPEDQTASMPSRVNTSFNGGLFILALFTVLYFTHEIVIPVLLAFITKLVRVFT